MNDKTARRLAAVMFTDIVGYIFFNKTEVYGDGVNIASRIQSMGVAGAILLSGNLIQV